MSNLIELIDEQYKILTNIGLKSDARIIQAAMTRLKDETFRVLITGEFSRGKSMLINALLGEEVLATSLLRLPVINVIHGGAKRAARAGRLGDLKDVPFDTIRELEGVTQVELTWDAPFLQEGIEMVEYPSMSEAPNSDAFRHTVESADLIVVVIACDSLYSHVEAEIIKKIMHTAGHRKPLFVANFVDRIASKDLESVKNSALVRLPVNQDQIFFVSAQNALDGDANSISDIASLRDKILEGAKNRQAVKYTRAHQLLRDSLDVATACLNTAHKMAREQKKQAEAKINMMHETFRELQNLQSRIQRDLNIFRDGTRDVIQAKIGTFVRGLALEVEDWGRDYKGHHLVEYLNRKLKEALTVFIQQDFAAYLRTRLKEQEDLLNNGFRRYCQQLNKLYNLLPENTPDVQINLGTIEFSPNLGEVQVTAHRTYKNTTSDVFELRSLVEVPEVMLTLVGTVVSSILFSQFALILLPTGVGLTAFLVARAQRSISTNEELKAYVAQIRGQAGRLESQVIQQINAEIDKLQAYVTHLLNSTMQDAQRAVEAKIRNLRDGANTTTDNVTKASLEQIRTMLRDLQRKDR